MPRSIWLVTAGLLAAPLTPNPAAAAPRAADKACVVSDFSPRSRAVGLKPVTVTFGVKTAACRTSGWSLAVERRPIATRSNPAAPLRPGDLTNADAGRYDISVWAVNSAGHGTLRDFPGGFRILRQTTWSGTTTSATTVVKAAPVTLRSRLLRVDWNRDRFTGHPRTAVQVQFRGAGSSATAWRTVKTVRTSTSGKVSTTIRPHGTGCWRLHFAGSTISGSSVTPDRLITVRPAALPT